MRSKTWITPSFAAKYAGPEGANFDCEPAPMRDNTRLETQTDTDEQKQSFIDDPESYHQYRKDLEYEVSTRFNFSVLGSKAQLDTLEAAKKIMRAKLAKKSELMERLVPDFAVGCRRPTPGMPSCALAGCRFTKSLAQVCNSWRLYARTTSTWSPTRLSDSPRKASRRSMASSANLM
jgi:hypothetical protein